MASSAKRPSVTFHQLLNQFSLFRLADKVLQGLAPGSLIAASPAVRDLDPSSSDLCIISWLIVLFLPPTVPANSIILLHVFRYSLPPIFSSDSLSSRKMLLACLSHPTHFRWPPWYCLNNPSGSAFPNGLWVPGMQELMLFSHHKGFTGACWNRPEQGQRGVVYLVLALWAPISCLWQWLPTLWAQ